MIKDNKYRYRKLIDSVYDGVYIFIDDKIAYSNYFLEGYNSEEKSVIGMSIELLEKSKGNEFNIVFDRIDDAYYEETLNGLSEMNALEEKIDTEFSDIYIE